MLIERLGTICNMNLTNLLHFGHLARLAYAMDCRLSVRLSVSNLQNQLLLKNQQWDIYVLYIIFLALTSQVCSYGVDPVIN